MEKSRTEAFTVRALVKDLGESFSSEECVWVYETLKKQQKDVEQKMEKSRTEAFTVRALVKDSPESFSSEECVWSYEIL